MDYTTFSESGGELCIGCNGFYMFAELCKVADGVYMCQSCTKEHDTTARVPVTDLVQ